MNFAEVYAISPYYMLPFLVTIPHSGEKVPAEASWLQGLEEPHLMRDVDRYVHLLYEPILQQLKVPTVIGDWHRYVVDLNRQPDEYDQDAVLGAANEKGSHTKGLHWVQTTIGEPLISEPISMQLHQQLVDNYYQPFHDEVARQAEEIKTAHGVVYHLDLHSMPSVGTDMHPDPGEKRADVVVSDYHGKSAATEFLDIVRAAYEEAGFKVAYNWPYVGGGVTRRYGQPEKGHHTIQVELNRDLYMDENSKGMVDEFFVTTQLRLCRAIEFVYERLVNQVGGE